jgi:hypothetical protein
MKQHAIVGLGLIIRGAKQRLVSLQKNISGGELGGAVGETKATLERRDGATSQRGVGLQDKRTWRGEGAGIFSTGSIASMRRGPMP